MEEKKFCYKYPHPAVTTDNVIFGINGKTLKVLLIKRGGEPYKNHWAFPGGFLEMNETIEEGAIRELKEETGLDNVFVQQFHAFSDPNRDPRERIISIGCLAVVNISDVKAGDDAEDAKWFPINQLPQLAFDHQYMFQKAVIYLKERLYLFKTGYLPLPKFLSSQSLETLNNIFSNFA